jgi:hypothetical protein
VKKLARLTLFFSLTFIIIFIAATGMRFLSLRIDWAKNLPTRPETTLTLILAAAHWALSLSIFSSILMTLNYISRRNHNPLMSIITIMVFSFIFSFWISSALQQWKSVPPAQHPVVSLGGNGVILSNSLNRNETAVVLLNGTAEPLGPRVIAISGQPLLFQRSVSTSFELPPVPFGDDTPWFLKSLAIDIRLNAQLLQQKFEEGFFSFLIFAGSLIFLLCSVGHAVKLSVWPLANLFLATLAFRGILAFNTFFTSPEMQETTSSFLNNMFPVSIALPLIFMVFGTLVFIYSFLVYVAKRKNNDDF